MIKIERKQHKIDATNKTVGRLSTQIAILLRGKHRPEYEPHIDAGDIVEVINAKKLKFTGNKLLQKQYHHYSGYPGGLKSETLIDVLKVSPERVLKMAVRKMLPDNKLRPNMLRRLIVRN